MRQTHKCVVTLMIATVGIARPTWCQGTIWTTRSTGKYNKKFALVLSFSCIDVARRVKLAHLASLDHLVSQVQL